MIPRERLIELDGAIIQSAQDADIPLLWSGEWSAIYVNADTGKVYEPHNGEERAFVEEDGPRHGLLKGGEGSGKSTAGIIKNLERLRRGMSGIMVSPDFEHFKKSLWKEFRQWCPWNQVVAEQRYRSRIGWEPTKPFTLTFQNSAELLCGGIEEPGAWEGPNVHFAHFDEARRHKSAEALKVLAGRVRLKGPEDEPPQLYLTTTPRKHWLFDYFGPVLEDDPLKAFKVDSLTVTLKTVENIENLDPEYERQRRSALTETEARVLMDAEWEDLDDVDRFLPSIALWDACRETLLPLDRHTPLFVAVDGAYAANGDTFGLIAVSRHPSKSDCLAIREERAWEATGKPRDFDDIEEEIKQFCLAFAVREIAYDPRELHHMMTRLRKASKMKDGRHFPGVHTIEFHQGVDREVADKQLLDLIVSRRILHSGQSKLRKHLDNADKKTVEGKRLRIIKRSTSLKIDLAVCASMASARASQKKDPSPVRSVSGVPTR